MLADQPSSDPPRHSTDLATALYKLGAYYRALGRIQEAIAAMTEAARLYNDMSSTDATFIPDAAHCLGYLALLHIEAGQHSVAVTFGEASAEIYRKLGPADKAQIPTLTIVLLNLGSSYCAIERGRDAVAATEEAAQLYLRMEKDAPNPARMADLAKIMHLLEERASAAGVPDHANVVWREVENNVSPWSEPYLYLARAQNAEAGHTQAAVWIDHALKLDEWITRSGQGISDGRALQAAAHEEARRHRSADAAAFDVQWRQLNGGDPLPNWLTLDPTLVYAALRWVENQTPEPGQDHLSAYPELLRADADCAVDEALLRMSEQEAVPYLALRSQARFERVEPLFTQLVMAPLTAAWENTDTVVDILMEWAGQVPERAAKIQRTSALLALARSGDAAPVLKALGWPITFPMVLLGFINGPDPENVILASIVALSAATAPAGVATSLFYLAAGTAITGNSAEAESLITKAYEICPAILPYMADIPPGLGKQHPVALSLLSYIINPKDDG